MKMSHLYALQRLINVKYKFLGLTLNINVDFNLFNFLLNRYGLELTLDKCDDKLIMYFSLLINFFIRFQVLKNTLCISANVKFIGQNCTRTASKLIP